MTRPGVAHGRRWVCERCLLAAEAAPRRFGQWTPLGELGQGAYGRVFLAVGPGRRLAALKLMKPDPFSSPEELVEAQARFKREAFILRGIDHPGILRLHDIGTENGARWVALELGDEDLRAVVKRQGRLGFLQAARIGGELLVALAYLHSLGVLHRDVKPMNVIVGVDGRVRLGDFGLCTMPGATRVTKPELGMGTLHFASPEQILDAHEVDPRTDIYGWGATLYYLLTGLPPYWHATSYPELVAALEAPPMHPAQLVEGIPELLSEVVLKALAVEPARRFASAREALDLMSVAR